jgi:uncharacterized protein YcbK (DUF882 family)
MHTGEDATITYKRNGRYIPEAMQQINYVLRDWRRNESTTMNPRLIDLAWEIYQQTGSDQPINIISGYRSPQTNEMLRANSNGVAQHSQHILGNAMDIQIPGVDITTLRNIALRMQIGGVGFYPTSGWPFIHIDVGSVRNWPRLSRTELASVFPDGHSLYIPADGVPLDGYNDALTAYDQRGDEVVALYGGAADTTTRLAGLFGGGNNANQTPVAATQPVTVAATIPPTVITEPPAPRPEIPGITVSDPGPVEALAFAPDADNERDPLAILNETPDPMVTAALPPPEPRPATTAVIQRHWYDPLVEITLPSVGGSDLPFLGTTTVRQGGFAQLTAPDVSGSPQFLAKPDRVMAVGFLTPYPSGASYRFAGPVTAERSMIDLTRLGQVAAR